MVGQGFSDTNVPAIVNNEYNDVPTTQSSQLVVCSSYHYTSVEQTGDTFEASCETGHTRNSSNTSQLSKASDYSSIHTHSRHSSSGDSSHIRYVKNVFFF